MINLIFNKKGMYIKMRIKNLKQLYFINESQMRAVSSFESFFKSLYALMNDTSHFDKFFDDYYTIDELNEYVKSLYEINNENIEKFFNDYNLKKQDEIDKIQLIISNTEDNDQNQRKISSLNKRIESLENNKIDINRYNIEDLLTSIENNSIEDVNLSNAFNIFKINNILNKNEKNICLEIYKILYVFNNDFTKKIDIYDIASCFKEKNKKFFNKFDSGLNINLLGFGDKLYSIILNYISTQVDVDVDDCLYIGDYFAKKFNPGNNDRYFDGNEDLIKINLTDFSKVLNNTIYNYKQYMNKDVSSSDIITIFEDENIEIVYPVSHPAFLYYLANKKIPDLTWCTQNISNWIKYQNQGTYIAIIYLKNEENHHRNKIISLKISKENPGEINFEETCNRYNKHMNNAQINEIYEKICKKNRINIASYVLNIKSKIKETVIKLNNDAETEKEKYEEFFDSDIDSRDLIDLNLKDEVYDIISKNFSHSILQTKEESDTSSLSPLQMHYHLENISKTKYENCIERPFAFFNQYLFDLSDGYYVNKTKKEIDDETRKNPGKEIKRRKLVQYENADIKKQNLINIFGETFTKLFVDICETNLFVNFIQKFIQNFNNLDDDDHKTSRQLLDSLLNKIYELGMKERGSNYSYLMCLLILLNNDYNFNNSISLEKVNDLFGKTLNSLTFFQYKQGTLFQIIEICKSAKLFKKGSILFDTFINSKCFQFVVEDYTFHKQINYNSNMSEFYKIILEKIKDDKTKNEFFEKIDYQLVAGSFYPNFDLFLRTKISRIDLENLIKYVENDALFYSLISDITTVFTKKFTNIDNSEINNYIAKMCQMFFNFKNRFDIFKTDIHLFKLVLILLIRKLKNKDISIFENIEFDIRKVISIKLLYDNIISAQFVSINNNDYLNIIRLINLLNDLLKVKDFALLFERLCDELEQQQHIQIIIEKSIALINRDIDENIKFLSSFMKNKISNNMLIMSFDNLSDNQIINFIDVILNKNDEKLKNTFLEFVKYCIESDFHSKFKTFLTNPKNKRNRIVNNLLNLISDDIKGEYEDYDLIKTDDIFDQEKLDLNSLLKKYIKLLIN